MSKPVMIERLTKDQVTPEMIVSAPLDKLEKIIDVLESNSIGNADTVFSDVKAGLDGVKGGMAAMGSSALQASEAMKKFAEQVPDWANVTGVSSVSFISFSSKNFLRDEQLQYSNEPLLYVDRDTCRVNAKEYDAFQAWKKAQEQPEKPIDVKPIRMIDLE